MLTVSATPTTSRFAIATGKAFDWMGVGDIYCFACSDRRSRGWREYECQSGKRVWA
jgi:hypothetical protein